MCVSCSVYIYVHIVVAVALGLAITITLTELHVGFVLYFFFEIIFLVLEHFVV